MKTLTAQEFKDLFAITIQGKQFYDIDKSLQCVECLQTVGFQRKEGSFLLDDCTCGEKKE